MSRPAQLVAVLLLASCEQCWGATPHDLHFVGDARSAPPCTFDADCPEQWACDEATCVPICASDADCPGAQTCAAGVTTDALVCRGSFEGRVPRNCSFDSDCADDHACDAHRCRARCERASDCAVPTSCASGRLPTREFVCRFVDL